MRRLFIVSLLLFYGGCRHGDGLERAAVSGHVTLDGVRLVEGCIAFYPCGNNKGPVAGGVIQAGNYSLNVHQGPAVGANRVEVHATRKTGRRVSSWGGAMIDEEVESIPGRYNTNSTLVVEVKTGKNAFDCELTSK